MLIDGPNEVFLADRDYAIFHVPGLSFWRRKDLNADLRNTLVDGVSRQGRARAKRGASGDLWVGPVGCQGEAITRWDQGATGEPGALVRNRARGGLRGDRAR